MNTSFRLASLSVAAVFLMKSALFAQEATPPPAPVETPAPPPPAEVAPLRELGATVEVERPSLSTSDPAAKASKGKSRTVSRNRSNGNAVVVFNQDAVVGEEVAANAVVAIGGSSTVRGDVAGAVVSIMGDSRIEGEAGGVVVSIIGNTYVNGKVDTAVAVLGGIELGPNAVVKDAYSVGGPIKRQPGSRVTGEAQEIAFLRYLPDFTGFRAWIRHALFWIRPLAFGPNLGWAWAVAGTFLGIYLAIALIFPRGIERCIETLETRPGRTLVATLVSLLLAPVVTVLLAITVIGPIFAVTAIAFAALMGKAAILGWLGRRTLVGFGAPTPAIKGALAVLVGGVLVAALYLVPGLGLAIWVLTTTLSLGLVVYTLLLGSKRRTAAMPTPPRGVSASGAVHVSTASVSAPMGRNLEGSGFVASGDAATLAASVADADPVMDPPIPGIAAAGPTVGSAALPISSLPRASFWIRTGALGIDVVLIGAVSLFVSAGSIFLLLLAVYGAVMWKLKGTTIGGIVCGLKVVRLDDRPIDWTTSIVRALASFLSLFAGGLGFIWVAFDDEKQSWHDKIAGTVVVTLPTGVSLV